MPSESGRTRRPQAAALDHNTECYASLSGTGYDAASAQLVGLVAAIAVLEAKLRLATSLALAEGASVSVVAAVLGVHRSSIYRRYARGSVGAKAGQNIPHASEVGDVWEGRR